MTVVRPVLTVNSAVDFPIVNGRNIPRPIVVSKMTVMSTAYIASTLVKHLQRFKHNSAYIL